MDIKKVKSKDLMSGNLARLLQEIESEVNSGNYANLDACLAELAKIGEKLEIKVNEDGTRTAVVKAKDGDVTEDIDFMAVAAQLRDEFKKGVATPSSLVTARKNFLKNVDKTLGTLLKENEVTEALISRGISNDVIKANGENEILRSQEKVKKLEPRLEKLNQTRDLLGEDSYIESAKRWDSKSDMTKVKDANQAEKDLNKIKEKFNEMSKLAAAIGKVDAATQQANIRKIDEIMTEIQNIKDNINDLQITGLDLSELNKEKINSHSSGSIRAKVRVVDTKLSEVQTNKDNALGDMRTVIGANQADFQEFLPAGIVPGALTEAQLMEVSKKLENKIKMYNKEIRFEQEYQNATRESIDKFKESMDKQAELSSKYTAVPVQVKVPVFKKRVRQRQKTEGGRLVVDASGAPVMEDVRDTAGNLVYERDTSGNLVYERDADGNLVQEVDEAGNPVYEKDADGNYILQNDPTGRVSHVANAATRAEALRSVGINSEADYINTAKTNAETAIANLSTARKRELIRNDYRRDGKFHPIKFLRSQFAANSMWESEYKAGYVSNARTNAENTARTELETHVQNATATEVAELSTKARLAEATRDFVVQELGSAVSRERILYNTRQGVDRGEIEDKATRAAVVAGLTKENKYIEYLSGSITREQLLTDLDELKKDENKEKIYARAYADDVRNPQQYSKTHKKTFTDRDDEGR